MGQFNHWKAEVERLQALQPPRDLGEKITRYQALVAVCRWHTEGTLQDGQPLEADCLVSGKRAGMRVHGRTGLPCPVCGDTVREVSFADRSLQYCATCQTGGQVLADRRMSRLLK